MKTYKLREINDTVLEVACEGEMGKCDYCNTFGDLRCILMKMKYHIHLCVVCVWAARQILLQVEKEEDDFIQ